MRASELLYDEGSLGTDLILYNQQLGLTLSANGVLNCIAQRGIFSNHEKLAEKLGLWDDALKSYEKKLLSDQSNDSLVIGKLNCLRNLSRYRELKETASIDPKYDMYKAMAAWNLFETDEFMKIAKDLPVPNSPTVEELYTFIIYNVLTNNYEKANELINNVYAKKSNKLFPLLFEDYDRAFNDVTTVSIMTEIGEIIEYKKLSEEIKIPMPWKQQEALFRMNRIKEVWKKRMNLISEKFPMILFEHLRYQSIVLGYSELKDQWM